MSMSHDEMIAVIQAHKDGKEIQCRDLAHKKGEPFEWLPAQPFWNFAIYEYRIKPTPPKPREWWIMPGPICVIRGSQSDTESKSFIHVREVLPNEGS